jgi:transcriptional regulator with XRE-family HTH domain
MSSGNQPSVRFRRIGGALRQAREDAGMTLETAGRRFGRSPAWLSTVENGLQAIRIDDLTELLDFYRVPEGPLRESLLHLAAQCRRKSKNWTRAYEGRISAAALDLASLEADSALIRTFQPDLIPGLLQTEAYMRALHAAVGRGTPHATDMLIDFRLSRQAVLTGPIPIGYQVIVGESALRQLIGGPLVMRHQLQHLAENSRLGGLSLRVLPFTSGAHLSLAGPFHLLTLQPPGRLTLTVVEQFTRSSFVEDDQEVEVHEGTFTDLLAAALDESTSLEVIERIASEL